MPFGQFQVGPLTAEMGEVRTQHDHAFDPGLLCQGQQTSQTLDVGFVKFGVGRFLRRGAVVQPGGEDQRLVPAQEGEQFLVRSGIQVLENHFNGGGKQNLP